MDSSEIKRKLITIFTKAKYGKYPPELLDDIDQLKKQLGIDTQLPPNEAFAILGLLLEKKYLKIDPTIGIVVSQSDDSNTFIEWIEKTKTI